MDYARGEVHEGEWADDSPVGTVGNPSNPQTQPANNSAADKAELDAAQLKVDNAKAAVDAAGQDDTAAADDLVKAEGDLKAVQDKQAK